MHLRRKWADDYWVTPEGGIAVTDEEKRQYHAFIATLKGEHMQEPYLGQRCHVEGVGFGTIVKIEEKPSVSGDTLTSIRVELDAGGSSWYELADVELLETYPAG